ncbi:hypothetical protein RND81_01G027800 [Saponaria officinalis]|uniref:Uncharacterized protein n=1 Tax=Saponaria officinalis TaxID=3572 RepID=A0AAW1NCI2_SAPOF
MPPKTRKYESGYEKHDDDDTTLADETNNEHCKPVDKPGDNVDNVSDAPSESDEQDINNTDDVNSDENVNVNFEGDIFDPRNWDKLDAKSLDDLAVKGPKRDLTIENGPKDRFKRHFCQIFILEFCQVEKNGIENGLFIQKNLIECFAFVVNYLENYREGVI